MSRMHPQMQSAAPFVTRAIFVAVRAPPEPVRLAPMLPAGDLSWSLRLVAGANLDAADTRVLQAASVLTATNRSANSSAAGSITLDDPHFQDPANKTLGARALPSVIRTGTGSLELFAGGDFTERSLYGIYPAGTQAPGVSTADDLPRANYPAPPSAGPSSVLGSLGNTISLNDATYNSAVADYQAYYPEDGGSLTLAAQGTVSGHVVATANTAGLPDSNAIGSWLWWQGGPSAPGAWWINFGTYAAFGSGGPGISTTIGFVGFTGIGSLGGGNVTVASAGNAGVLTVPTTSSGSQSISGGLDVAVASTGRTDVGTGGQTLTGGGTLTLAVGGRLNPGAQSTGLADLNGTLTDLRGNMAVQAGAIGSLALTYGGQRRQPRRRRGRCGDRHTGRRTSRGDR